MRIHVVSVGKVKEKYIKQGIAEFEKRLRPYCTLSLTEVNDEHLRDLLSKFIRGL